MNDENKILLAHRIIDKYCEVNNFNRKYFAKKWGKNPVKVYNNVKVSKHRQVIALYLNKVLELKMSYIGPLIGYKDHSTVSVSVKKFTFLKEFGDEEINNLWNNMSEWADKIGRAHV